MGTLHEDQYTFFFVTCSVLPRMRNVSDKSGGEYENTHCMFSIFFFENFANYERLWKNIVKLGRPQLTV